MEYTVIFDVSQSGYRNWWFPACGLIFVVIGSALFRFRHQLTPDTPKLSYFFLGFGIFWTIVTFAVTAGDYSSLASALREGRCEVITGEVTQFRTMPGSEHYTERFAVDGHHFKYSDSIVSPGFNNTSSHGGPIREGLKVRIHHAGNDIARLEVAK